MAELHIKSKVKTSKSTSYEPIFDGLFVMSQLSKNVCKVLNISPNEFVLLKNRYKTDLDSSEFEKIFDVYCSDEINAMRILTADTMEALTTFYNKYKIDFQILLKDNELYLRFFTGNLFEYKRLKSMTNKKELFLYYRTVRFAIDLTKKINRVVDEFEM